MTGYKCSCDCEIFKVGEGLIKCADCGREYRVSELVSTKRFNNERNRFLKLDDVSEAFKRSER